MKKHKPKFYFDKPVNFEQIEKYLTRIMNDDTLKINEENEYERKQIIKDYEDWCK